MKQLLISILIFFFTCSAQATTYYISASGNDGNNGTSTSTPWRTIAKVNAASLLAGDIVRFNGGDLFVGNLIITHSGTSGNPITYNSYGTGNATITGFTTVSTWTNLGGNIYESSSAVSTLSTCNMVTINGIEYAMGRTPNNGWYQINSVNSTVAISSSSINSSVINWSGADMVVRVNRYTEGKSTITSSSGSNLNYSPALSDIPQVNYGFFIQNDPRTLDTQNEWYYNPSTKKIRIYSTSTPTNVQISTVDTLVYQNNISYITYSNINFTGANKYAVKINNSNGEPYGSHITFQGCNFDFNGLSAIDVYATTYPIVSDCTFNHSGNFAINLGGQGSQYATVTNNSIRNTGMLQGMGLNNSSAFKGIHSLGSFSNISHNIIDSTGYNALEFDGDSVITDSNYVTNYTQLLDDGGGIYTFPSLSQTSQIQRTIKNNIVLYGGDAHSGTPDNSTQTAGIYCDGASTNVDVLNNTVANTNWGVLLNNNINMNYLNNTIYNCAVSDYIVNYNALVPLINLTIKHNIFFAQTATQWTQKWEFQNVTPALPSGYNSDSNYFARPIDDNLDIVWQISDFSLAQWRTFSSQDLHSGKSPATISNVNQLFFAYNPNSYDSTVTIPAGNWIDVTGTPYNTGSTILHAYSSIVLISTGTNIPPIANAGTNVNITLPTNSFTQVGSGTDADGTIVGYSWTQFSGPSSATIGSPTSATTLISNLIAGTYVFQLKVTDNGGATGTDTMSAVVNSSPPPNQPPIVNAGGNKIITLPTSSVTQSGSATDPDGTIASYQWTQTLTNPIPATIASPTNPVTVINGMTVAGVYRFILTATDNLGATGSQSITVTVNAATPIPPTANAGVDQSITWPTNSVTLSGSATAGTGTIASYSWAKISGGVATITNSNSASTTVTGLDVGTYLFQLTVTDNSGLQGKDTMQVIVNKGAASLSYTVTSVTYNGFPQSIGIVTSPAGLATSTLYNGVGASPISAGSYATVSNITDLAHWNSTAIMGVFTINPATGNFTASNQTFQYDSLSHTITVVTSDPRITYTLSNTPQRYKGVYSFTIHNTNTNFNVPDLTVTLTITAGQAPMPTWSPLDMIYGQTVGVNQLNAADSKTGAFNYTPTTGFAPSAGSLQLKLDFVPSDTNLAPITGITRTINVAKRTDVITVIDTIQYADGTSKTIHPTTLYGGSITITGGTGTAVGNYPYTVTYSDPNNQASPVSGTLHILSNAATIYMTNYQNLVYTGSPLSPMVNCPYSYSLSFSPSNHTNVNASIEVIATINDGIHTGADTVFMNIIKATPTGTWAAISPVSYIYTVQSGILNASTATAGTWAYNVNVGDTLVPGTYNLLGTFTPTDATDYNSITLSNSILVNKGSATISITNTSKQYNTQVQYATVTTTPPNLDSLVITYTGNHQDVGSYPITAQLFSNLYTAPIITGTLTISQVNYTLSWATPAPIQQGTALNYALPSSSIAGTFTYNYPIGYIAQSNLTLIATFHPTDTNYPIQTISVFQSVYGNPVQNHYIKHGKTIYLNYPAQ